MNYHVVICILLVIVVFGALAYKQSSAPFDYTVEIIDGCEYLRFHTHYHDAITHKGNCKNH